MSRYDIFPISGLAVLGALEGKGGGGGGGSLLEEEEKLAAKHAKKEIE